MGSDALELGLVMTRLDELSRILRGQRESPWMSTSEAAAFLRCSESKIHKLVAAGDLPFYRQDPSVARSPRLYHRKHLTAFLVTGKNPTVRRLTATEKQEVEELLS